MDKQEFKVSELISQRNVLLLNGISTKGGLNKLGEKERCIPQRFEYSLSGKNIFVASFKQNERIKLIYQEMGFILKEGIIYNICKKDSGLESNSISYPNKYTWDEIDIVLDDKRKEYNEFIVRAERIYGFFIKSWPETKILSRDCLKFLS